MKRRIIQAVFFIASVVVLYLVLREFIDYDVHYFCPYSIVCFGLSSRFFILYGVMILGVLIPVSAIFLGRWFCSYVCYLGTGQDAVFGVRKMAFGRRFSVIPTKVNKYLQYLKYIVLLATVTLAFFGKSWYTNFCPQNVMTMTNIGLSVYAGTLALIFLCSAIIPRFWCQYLCPFGALQSLFIRIGSIVKRK